MGVGTGPTVVVETRVFHGHSPNKCGEFVQKSSSGTSFLSAPRQLHDRCVLGRSNMMETVKDVWHTLRRMNYRTLLLQFIQLGGI